MTTRERLQASLDAFTDTDGFYYENGNYADWSPCNAGVRLLEVGDADGGVVQLGLTRDEMFRLHAALTRTLLADEGR